MKELVSVIIPTYNREKELYNAIESVLNQTYSNIEIIVIDDNAKNKVLRDRVYREIETKYPKVKLIHNSENLGGSKSRNIGIENSKGKYIAFLDDDDLFYKNKIEIFMNEKVNENGEEIDFLYSGCVAKDFETNKEIQIYNKAIPPKNKILFSHMCSNICATSQMMIKRDLLMKINGFPDVSAKQDYLLILKILLEKDIKVHKIPKILSIYYEHNNGRISSASMKRLQAEEMAYEETKKYFSLLTEKEVKEVYKSHLKRLFNIAYLMNDKKLMIKYLKDILKREIYFKGIIKYFISKYN